MNLPISKTGRLVLGLTDDIIPIDVDLFGASWRRLLKRFLRRKDDVFPSIHGRWQTLAKRLLKEKDDLCFVAGMTKKKRRRLIRTGVDTLTKLASSSNDDLQRQAKLQLESTSELKWELKKTLDESVLPQKNENDSYFDLEGDPFAKREYLWGILLENGEWHPLWAHDRAAENVCLRTFLDDAYDRYHQHGGRVYHYGHYEMTALRRCVVGDEQREAMFEEMVRHGAFVDLYKIVKRYLRIGAESYSLKSVELLYTKRSKDDDVADAVSSVVAYDAWTATKDPSILESLEAYNKFDCESTKNLVDWLRTNIDIRPASFSSVPEEEDEEKQRAREDEERYRREVALGLDVDTRGWIEYHRRELRPLWRQRREWLEALPSELADDERCLGMATPVSKMLPEKGKRRSQYRLRYPPQTTRLAVGAKVSVRNDMDFDAKVIPAEITEVASDVITVAASTEPPSECSLIPDEFVNPEPIPGAIARACEHIKEEGALCDFVAKRSPRLFQERNISKITDPDGIADVILAMDRTTLAIRGPPGTGKTYVAAVAISRLLDAGYKVAATAPSHDTIEHLLSNVQTTATKLKIGGSKNKKNLLERRPSLDKKTALDIAQASGPLLVGGTAWAFAKERSLGVYDYLFVDEAGQVPSANLVGMARCARNVVLVGDQAQLPAPTRGSHPGTSGASCLEHYLDDNVDHIFLPASRRLRPEICHVISKLFYNGALYSHETAQKSLVRLASDPYPDAGLCTIDVESETDSTTSNAAEAAVVVDVVSTLLRTRRLQDRPLSKTDIMVVVPYNAQARLIRDLLPGVPVGTVDMFQGNEAPIVVASMCASQDDESEEPLSHRSISFVLDKRRLNVALSRAQCLAVLVASPHLADADTSSLDTMAILATYARLLELANVSITIDPDDDDDDDVTVASSDTSSPLLPPGPIPF